MATVNTNDLRIKNSQNFIDALNGIAKAESYVFVGRVQPWADENVPPPPENNNAEFYSTWDNIFAMKRINDIDAVHLIPRVTWSGGEVYDRYQHNYSAANKAYSGASNLYDAKFYVINSLNYVYACLDNNSNSTSTVEPASSGYEPFTTSDGYQWLRLYNLSSSSLATRATNNYLPITTNEASNVVNGQAGEIYTVIVNNGGVGYTINPAGVQNQVSEYFAHIDGDGTGAVAKVTISQTVVTKVEIVRYGSNYTFGTLDFSSGRVYANLADLDNAVNGLNPEGNGGLRTTVIIPPPGGWGSDLVRQLGATRVGIFSNLGYAEFKNFFPASFRQIGIMQDFEYTGTNPDPIQTCYGVKTSTLPTGTSFRVGVEIQQEVQVAVNTNGTPRMTTKIAKGFVIGWDDVSTIIRYTQSSANVDSDGELYRFQGTAAITQGDLSVTPDTDFTSNDVNGIEFKDGYSVSPVTKYTGLMTYLANISPVVRDPNQTERINLVIAF